MRRYDRFPAHCQSCPPPTAKALALEDWLVVLIMAALALITFANVLLRYFTDTSFAWTEEISIFLMIVLAMVGGSSAVARDQHIRIEFFSGNGSAQRRRRLARLGALMTALLFTVLAVLSVRLVWDDWRYEETSPGIGVPQWWYSMWLPICSVAIALRALGLFVRQGHPAAFAPEMIEGTEAAENTTAPAQTQKPQADQP
ncbi:MAG: TRAP transporter small permease [Burkholderiales bacterium]|nr:TRAP transporter small permease [Burkholderiales bacterium]